MIRVVAAVIRRGGKVLLAQRPIGKRHGGLWEFPGGKLEPGERDEDAAKRELAEELGVDVVAVGALLAELADPGSPYVIAYREVEIAGSPKALEHQTLQWVTAQAAEGYALAPSDRRFVDSVLRPTDATPKVVSEARPQRSEP